MAVLTSLWPLRVVKLWMSAVQHPLMATTLDSWMSRNEVTLQWASTQNITCLYMYVIRSVGSLLPRLLQ